MDAIRDGYAIAITDGVFKEETGISAYATDSRDTYGQFIAINVVLGYPEDQTSLQRELAGFYGVVV